jgi:hypothetical protein
MFVLLSLGLSGHFGSFTRILTDGEVVLLVEGGYSKVYFGAASFFLRTSRHADTLMRNDGHTIRYFWKNFESVRFADIRYVILA